MMDWNWTKTGHPDSAIGVADARTTCAWAFTVVTAGLTVKIGEATGEDTDIGEAKGEAAATGEAAAKGEANDIGEGTMLWFCILDF